MSLLIPRPALGTYDIAKTGRVVRANADGVPRYKPGGLIVDWSVVPVVNSGADTTWTDGTVVYAGFKALRYGTVLTKINAGAPVITLTIDATGGTYTVSLTVNGVGPQATTALAYNANAAAIQAALRLLSNVGAGNINVTGTGPFTITGAGALATAIITGTTNAASLTGGASTAVLAQTGQGGNEGLFGPYTAGAFDGRQNLNRGEAFILDVTVVQTDFKSDQAPGGVFDGGLTFLLRCLNNGSDLTTNPTRSQIEAAFPAITWVED